MRNQETLDELVRILEGNCADLLDAARRLSLPLRFIQQWRKDDPETDRVITEALAAGVHGLISEATRRAVQGTTREIYYKGEVVGEQQEYSDTLLTTLLKARVPEFRSDEASRPQIQVNIANLMPRASSYEEWLSMKEQTVRPQLSAPTDDHVIEATYEEVSDPFKGLTL